MTNFGHLQQLVHDTDADIVLVTETHIRQQDTLQHMCASMGVKWKMINQARGVTTGKDGRAKAARGGVGVICTSPHAFTICRIMGDSRGLLTVEVRAKKGDWEPYLIVASYIPPIGSPFEEDRDPLFARAREVIARAKQQYGHRLLYGGDFNTRLPKIGNTRRFTADSSTISDPERRNGALMEILEDYSLSPCWGRTKDTMAQVNSRAICKPGTAPQQGEGREVCYICLDSSLNNYELMLTPGWDSINHGETHIPQGIVLTLEHALPSPPPPPKKARRWLAPDYNDTKAWGAVAGAVKAAMLGVASTVEDTTISTGDAIHAWTEAYKEALDNTLGISCSASQGGKGSGGQRWAPQTARSRHAAAGRRRKKVDPKLNRALPPYVLEALRTADKEGTAESQAAVRKAFKKLKRALRRKDVFGVEAMRRNAPKKLFDHLAGVLAPEDPTTFAPAQPIPHEEGKDPPLLRFEKSFRELMGAVKPEPPAAKDEEWLKWVRETEAAPDNLLGRKFEPIEVLLVLFPDNGLADLRCPASGKASEDTCTACRALRCAARKWGGEGDLKHDPPHFQPRGAAQKTINGELRLTHVAWARPADDSEGSAHEYRLLVATTICSLLNRCLADGAVPLDMAELLAVPIEKKDTPNRADPDGYRYTAMPGLLMKVLDLVITARITHFAARTGAVGADHQGAFTRGMSTEWHSIAARELIKNAWRQCNDVFMVFVDFKKAYDNVHPEVLLAVLKRWGVPANLCKLVKNWFAQRRTRVRVNGELSDLIITIMGLGQGSNSSPIFFNLIVNSLNRYLKSLGMAVGITVGRGEGGQRIISLTFADDINCPTESAQAAETVLRAIERWCKAWGMIINVGVKKTAVLPLICPNHRSFPSLQPGALHTITLADGTVVPYCTEYTYLGSTISSSMATEHITKKFTRHIRAAFARFFNYNSVVEKLSPAGVLQIIKAEALSSYLLCITPWTANAENAINRQLAKIARRITGLPRAAPIELLLLITGLPSAAQLMARERARILAGLQVTDHESAPARVVLNAVGYEYGSWRKETTQKLLGYETEGAVMGWNVPGLREADAPLATEVGRIAAITGRSVGTVALNKWAGKPLDRGYVAMSQQWEDSKPRQSVMNMLFSGKYSLQGELTLHRATPLSALVLGGAGFLAQRVNAHIPRKWIRALAATWLGPAAMGSKELGPEAWRIKSDAGGGAYRELAEGRQCPLCKASTASAEHIINACTGEQKSLGLSMVMERQQLRLQARRYIGHLVLLMEKARGEEGGAAKLDVDSIDWETATGKAMLYRLVVVAPWPAASVDKAGESVCRELGEMFDSTVVANRSLRRLANSWVAWGGKRLVRICKAWAAAVDEEYVAD